MTPTQKPEDEQNIPEESLEEEKSSASTTIGQAVGFGLGAGILIKGKGGEEKEKKVENIEEKQEKEEAIPPQETPKEQSFVPTPPAQPTAVLSGLKPVFSSLVRTFGGLFKRVLGLGITALSGGTSKLLQGVLKVGGKLLSFLGGVFGQVGQTDTSDTLKKISLAVLLLVILPIFLIFALSFFDLGILRPTALVSGPIGPTAGATTPLPTSPISQPSPISLSPTTSPPLLGQLTQGFPVSSSCVTQPPGGAFSHSALNAVDIGAIAQNSAWIVRSTHPGRVIVAGSFGGLGLTVLLESLDQRFITYYGHLRVGSIWVGVGDIVERETALGIVNNTGFSAGNHLHYEIRGPRNASAPWGSKAGEFGHIGTILNFLPNCNTWSCQWYCSQ